MSNRTRNPFQPVKTEKPILPMDLPGRVADQDSGLDAHRRARDAARGAGRCHIEPQLPLSVFIPLPA